MSVFSTLILTRRRFVFFFSVVLCLILLLFFQSFYYGFLHALQRPFVRLATRISHSTQSIFASILIKETEMEQVRKERDQFLVDQVKLYELTRENDQLKQEIGFMTQRRIEGVPANITQRYITNESSFIVVDAGSKQEIKMGTAVMIGEGFFIGKVTDVRENESVITLSQDQTSATGVALLNKTRTIGIAKGKFGNLIELKFIPVDESIQPNDIVITSGLEEHVPSGLIVGLINKVQPELESPFQQAIVEPTVDIRQYNHVILLK